VSIMSDGKVPSSCHTVGMPRGRARTVVFWIGVASLIPLVVVMAARAWGIENGPLAALVSLTPWLVLASLLPLTLALLARSWVLAAVAGVLAAVCVSWQVPLFTGRGDGEPALTVASVNMRFGDASAADVVALVRQSDVDVLALTELTPESVAALDAAGLGRELPFNEALPEEGFTGTGLWSRYPLVGEDPPDGFLSRQIRAVVETPEGEITVFAVHPRAPRSVDNHVWERELASLKVILSEAQGPVIVAGDFNTTRDHKAFRAIEALGYANAADEARSGFAPTFPVGRGPFPFVVIDHVLERGTGLHAVATQTVEITDTDHKALVVTFARD
jgi:endonuclease/exonuclease/phosphatase (EEP) superfamily protein YafD